ncbi:MAG: T9SS type A sorting domain-containing protein [Saprospiraceae bacterium]|nr:T9SS type A sorting domain-containing protein [Saprospiraceae bacterium]
MQQRLLTLCFFANTLAALSAQNGCPGCVVNLPAGLPADTLYMPALPDGEKGTPYNQDISFRVPKTTTPVHAIDSTTPPGLAISKIEIVGIDDLPPGLFWQANQTVFETATQTDGCIKICGTPTKTDTFVMTVRLKATVFIFSQEASFPMTMYVAPKISITDGFTMTNVTGCGSTTVSFTNNVPSNGASGFTYAWNFGDSTTFSGENPPPHHYTKPGKYVVSYHAKIDTVGYRLVSATVLSVTCTDLVSAPDLYMFIKNTAGTVVFHSGADITNATLPLTFPIGIPLDPQDNYNLEVWDEDSGLEGSDDLCGAVPFNILSGDTLTSGGFKIVLNVENPIEEVFSADTVTVYPKPLKPLITANKLSVCEGSDEIVLESSFGGGNHWWLNGQQIPGATDFLYMPDTSGYYQVQVQNIYGCTNISDSAHVQFIPLPKKPTYLVDRNNLKLIDTLALPANYALQWFLAAGPIPGATGFTHCATVSGNYTLVVTDLATGCTNEFSASITIDPNYDCTIGAEELTAGTLRIFPNPASAQLTVELASPLPENCLLRIWDIAGRLVQQIPAGAGANRILVDSSPLDAGVYLLELTLSNQRFIGRLSVVR